MSNANDIKNLFSKFGGKPEAYRELALENDAVHSRARWPMLTAISPDQPEHPPGVAGRTAAAPSRRRPYLGFGAVRQSNADTVAPSPGGVSDNTETRATSPVMTSAASARTAPSPAPLQPSPAAEPARLPARFKTDSILQVERNVPAAPPARPALAGKPLAFRGTERVEPTLVARHPPAVAAMPASVEVPAAVPSPVVPMAVAAPAPPSAAPSVTGATPAQLALRRLSNPAAVAPQVEPEAAEPPAAAPQPATGFGLPALLARLAGR